MSHFKPTRARRALVTAVAAVLAACNDAPPAPAAPDVPAAPASVASTGIILYVPPPVAFVHYNWNDSVDSIFTASPGFSGVKKLTKGMQPAWSPDHKQLAFVRYVGGYFQIFTINADGTGLKQITWSASHHENPKWSPDGTRIAFDGNVKEVKNYDVYVMNANGTGLVRLTSNSAFDGEPAWRPDGKYIAFSSTRVGIPSQVFKINVDGLTHTSTRVTYDANGALEPAYSPNGTKLLYGNDFVPGSACGLVVANADGTSPKPIVNGLSHCEDASFSPDGTQITASAVMASAGSAYHAYTMNLDGTNAKRLLSSSTTPELDPSWSAY